MSYLFSLLTGIITANPECAAIFAPEGNLLKMGEILFQPEVADALDLLGKEGAGPFYAGDVADRVADWLADRGGLITREDLAAYRVVEREPLSTTYRGRQIITPPPPSAGGLLVAVTLSRLGEDPSAPSPAALIAAMEEAQNARTTEFLEGLNESGFASEFLGSHLGNTTHISTIDSDGLACSVTCSNGSSSGVVVPSTGIHLNNMMGEQDLNPHGFHMHPPGRRLPSMMTPTLVLNESRPTMSVGSAGSNRIRSAIVQTLIQMIDAEVTVEDAVDAARLHFEDGVIYAEPGIDIQQLEETGHGVAAFQNKHLFFGGVQAAVKTTSGLLAGAGDPRRGGVAEVAR
jgi:gamma-glutamyltranspeptidase/glutathione hydrolase